jgi:PPOX class probable F420-dependent enzyme
MTDATGLADEKYVVLTTTKRSGDKVPTAVWIAGMPGGALGFTTDLTSGKAKRIRNFPEVTLQPCNSRGVPKPGTEPVSARATVLSGADAEPIEQAIKAKYGFMVTLVNVGYEIGRIVRRRQKQPSGAIRIELV